MNQRLPSVFGMQEVSCWGRQISMSLRWALQQLTVISDPFGILIVLRRHPKKILCREDRQGVLRRLLQESSLLPPLERIRVDLFGNLLLIVDWLG